MTGPNIRRRDPRVGRPDLDRIIELDGGVSWIEKLQPHTMFRPDGFTIEWLDAGTIRNVYLIQLWVGKQHQLVSGPCPLMTLENMLMPTVEVGNEISVLFANYSDEKVRFKISFQGKEAL